MKEIISLKNVRRARYNKGDGFELVKVFYSDTSEYLEYHYDIKNSENKYKCYELYVKIKNALINKQEFVEVEL